MSEIEPGIYRHYKGGHYAVIGLGVHHESREPYVIYVSLANGTVNLRPLHPMTGDPDGFSSSVIVAGQAMKRFEYIGRSIEAVESADGPRPTSEQVRVFFMSPLVYPGKGSEFCAVCMEPIGPTETRVGIGFGGGTGADGHFAHRLCYNAVSEGLATNKLNAEVR